MIRSLFLFCCFASLLNAQSIMQDQIPPALKPWQDWVLFGMADGFCPCNYNDSKAIQCAWPTRLAVEANNEGGSFVQEWTVFNPGWVELPGGTTAWAQDVTINGVAQPVLARLNSPVVYLQRGTHQIKGRWAWKVPPQSIFIPEHTALVQLTLNGEQISYPRRDAALLWLKLNAAQEAEEQDRLTVKAYRLFEDRMPMVSTLNIHLEISGKDREINLGRLLLSGFLPMSLNSSLRAHLDSEGKLVVQAQSGSYDIELISHAQSSQSELAFEIKSEYWPTTELWSFAPAPQIRSVVPTGMNAIDPTQSEMPQAWKNNSCFLAEPATKLILEEHSRGLSTHPPNQINITRQLWLDFDGGGYTFEDQVSGQLNAQWRVSFMAPYVPGRVLLSGAPQLITLSGNPALAGVAVHNRQLDMTVNGRLAAQSQVPATGLDLTADSLQTRLILPPGWRLLGAIGPDLVQGDWVNSWSIWRFFLVFLLSAAAAKLWGKKQGLLTLATLVLLHAEPAAPQVIWFVLLGLIGLERVAKNQLLRVVVFFKNMTLVILVLFCLVFFKSQFLKALYPNMSMGITRTQGGFVGSPPEAMPQAAPEGEAPASDDLEIGIPVEKNFDSQEDAYFTANLPVVEEYKQEGQYLREREDLKLQGKVQTGPGVPDWNAYSAVLNWQGPIEPDDGLRLFLLPPWLNLVLTMIRLGLLVWLIVLVAGVQVKRVQLPKAASIALALCFVFGFTSLSRAQDIPSPELLNQLKERLMIPSTCFPNCADIEEASLSENGSQIELSLVAHAATRVAMPLPGLPESVSLSTGPTTLRFNEGQMWVLLSEGIHEIKCVFQLKDKNVLKLRLPIVPHRLSESLENWDLTGLRDDGTCEEQLELRRSGGGESSEYAEAEESSSFLNMDIKVYRVAHLGTAWSVQSHIVRGNEGPVVLEIPLLPGEKVVSDARVVNGKIQVNLPEGTDQFEWRSTLDPVTDWTWTAPTGVVWHEVWQVVPSSIWTVSWTSGENETPLIFYFSESEEDTNDSSLQPLWLPRQGEVLNLKIVQPDSMEGQSLTFERVDLNVSPGQKTTDYQLTLMVSSSIGGEHKIQLPPEAILASHVANGKELPIRFENGLLVLPLSPDKVEQVIRFSLPEGIKIHQGAAALDLNHGSVNLSTTVNLPSARWLLWLSGPKLGPVLLFWPILLTLILVAFGLVRLMPDSLTAYQWILLGLGISQLHILAGLIVVLWFVALRWRKNLPETKMNSAWFGLLQLVLVGLTFSFFLVILLSLRSGLLGQPEMYMAEPLQGGLAWYQDRSLGTLPTVSILSLPFWVYRLVMLFWALWLANSMLRWLREAWMSFSAHRLWPPPAPKRVRPRANPNEFDPHPVDPNGPVANAGAPEPTPTGADSEAQGPLKGPSFDDTLPGGYMVENAEFEQHNHEQEGEGSGGADEEPPIRKPPS